MSDLGSISWRRFPLFFFATLRKTRWPVLVSCDWWLRPPKEKKGFTNDSRLSFDAAYDFVFFVRQRSGFVCFKLGIKGWFFHGDVSRCNVVFKGTLALGLKLFSRWCFSENLRKIAIYIYVWIYTTIWKKIHESYGKTYGASVNSQPFRRNGFTEVETQEFLKTFEHFCDLATPTPQCWRMLLMNWWTSVYPDFNRHYPWAFVADVISIFQSFCWRRGKSNREMPTLQAFLGLSWAVNFWAASFGPSFFWGGQFSMKGGMFLWNFFRRFPGQVMELLSWQGFKNRVEDGGVFW